MNVEDLMKEAQIAAPCHVNWEDMTGDDKQRFCGDCKLNVLNAEAMTDDEVLQALLKAQNGERVCMQIYKRADGTILTQNCPKGIKLIRERARQAAAWLAGALSMMLSTVVSAAPGTGTKSDTTDKSKPTWHATVKGDCPEAVSTTAQAGGATSPDVKVNHHVRRGKIAVAPTPEMIKRQQSVVAQAKKTNPESLETADAMTSLSSLHRRRGNDTAALPLSLAALKIYENKKALQQASYASSAVHSIYSSLGDTKSASAYEKKAAHYQQLAEAAEKGK